MLRRTADASSTTVIPVDGGLSNGEIGVLLDTPAPEGDQVQDRLLSADEWADLRLSRPEHYRHNVRAPGAHVDVAQREEGRACERCGHVAHRGPVRAGHA